MNALTSAGALPAAPIVDIGVAIGLIEPGSTAQDVQVRMDWFANPIEEVRGAVADPVRRAAILRAAAAILQQLPSAIGGEEWLGFGDDIPLRFLLREEEGGLVIGVGADHTWTVGADVSLEVHVEAVVLHASDTGLRVAGTSVFDAIGADPFPFLRSKVTLDLPNEPSPVDAIELTTNLALTAVDAALVVHVDGVPVAIDLDDGDGALSGSLELLRTLLWALADQLSSHDEVRRVRDHLFGMLGWNPKDTSVPPLDLLALIQDAEAELRRWADALVATPEHLRAFLRQILGLFWDGDVGALPDLGVGDEACIPLTSGTGGDPTLLLCAEVVTTADGARHLRVFATCEAWSNLDADRRLTARARAALFSIGLTGAPSITAAPSLAITLSLANPGGGPVLSADLSAHAEPGIAALGLFSVGTAEAGLTISEAGVVPVLALTDVHAAGTVHGRLDLTNLDAVIEAGTGAIEASLRAALLALLGSEPFVARLAALLGLPPSTSTLPALDLALLVSDPKAAFAAWLTALITEHGGDRKLSLWLAELRALLIDLGATLPPLPGAGTEADPWRLPLVAGPPSLSLTFHVVESPEARCLHVGLVLDPPAALLGPGIALDPRITVRLLRACVTKTTGALTAELLPGARASAVLGTNLRLELGSGWAVTAHRVAFVVDWERGSLPVPDAWVRDLALVEGTLPRLSLPKLDLRSVGWDPTDADLPAFLLRLLEIGFAQFGVQSAVGELVVGLARLLGDSQGRWPSIPVSSANLPDLQDLLADPWRALWARIAAIFTDLSGLGPGRVPQVELLGGLVQSLLGLATDAARSGLSGVPTPPVLGGGTYSNPWRWELANPGHPVELLAWVDPDGPTSSNAIAQVDRWIAAHPTSAELTLDAIWTTLARAGDLLPSLGGSLASMGRAQFDAALTRLEALLASHPLVTTAANAYAAEVARLLALLGPTPSFCVTLPGQAPTDWDKVKAALDDAGHTLEHIDLSEAAEDTVAEILALLLAELQARSTPPIVLAHGAGAALMQAVVAGSASSLVAGAVLGTSLVAAGAPLAVGAGAEADLLRLLVQAPVWDDGGMRAAIERILAGVSNGWSGPGVQRARHGFESAVGAQLMPLLGPPQVPVADFASLLPMPNKSGSVRAAVLGAVRAWILDTFGGATRRPMTHVSFGIRGGVVLGSAPDVQADVTARFDLIALPLPGITTPPEHPTPRLTLHADVRRPGGWLVGNPITDPRLRWMEADLTWSPAGWEPSVQLHDAAFHGLALPITRPTDPSFAPLLDAWTLPPGSPLGPLLDLLVGIGLLSGNTTDGWRVLALPLDAFLADATAFITARLTAPAGLDLTPLGTGLAGFGFVAHANSWTLSLGTWTLSLDHTGRLTLTATTGPLQGSFSMQVVGSGAPPALSLTCSPLDLGVDLHIGGSLPGPVSVMLVPTGPLALRLLPGSVALSAPGDLGPTLLELLWRCAAELLAGRLFVGLALPQLPAGVVDVLRALGFLDAGGFVPGRFIALCDDPAWLVDPARLTLAQGSVSLGALGTLSLVSAGGVATLRLQAAPFLLGSTGAGDLSLAYDVTLRLVPNLEIAGSAELQVPLGGGSSLGLALGSGAGAFSCAFTLRTSPADPAPVVLQLAPTLSGFETLAGSAARKLVPLAIEALLEELAGLGSPVDQVAVALRDMLVALEAGALAPSTGRFAFHPGALDVLLTDPFAGFSGTGATTGGLPAVLTALSSLCASAGFPVGSLGAPGRLSLPLNPGLPGASGTLPLSLVVGTEGTGASTRFGAWIEAATTGWPSDVLVVPSSPSALGVLWGSGGFAPKVEIALAVRVPAAAFPFTPTLSLSVPGGALTLVVGLDSPWTTNDLAITVLPGFSAAGTDPLDLFGAYVVPLLLHIVKDLPALGQPIAGSALTLGSLLVEMGLLRETSGTRSLPNSAPTPMSVASGAIAAALKALTAHGPDAIKDYFYYDPATTSGIREAGVQIPAIDNLQVLEDPSIEILFGLVDEGWSVRIPLLVLEPAPRFDVGFRLGGLGVRVGGSGDAPLLANEYLHIGELGAGIFVDVEPGGTAPAGGYVHGGFIEVDDIRLPLGQGGGGGVAGSLLPDTAENPGFGLRASWSVGTGFELTFPDAPEKPELWWEIDQEFGPLDVQRIGVQILPNWPTTAEPPGIALLLDASFGLGGLEITVDDFGVRLPVRTIADPGTWEITLGGLGVHFEQSEITISGALRRKDDTTYAGAAIVKAFGFELSAIGEYSKKDDYTSLFIFAKLGVPLGGPPFFFVTGIAAGFGYNRAFEIPADLGALAEHPLLGVMSGSLTTSQALNEIDESLPARRGSHWVAGGVTFTSFVFIEGTALVYVLLDDAVTIGLIGKASFQLPMGLPLLSVELAVEAAIRIGPDPFVMVRAQLTDGSWLLSRDCKLTGGFAFGAWFERGDSVLTVGGYHPAFVKPDHYPDVPRVGFRWQVGSAIVAKGGIYFALTPREVMGGASVHVSGKWGPARAWLDVGIDGLLGWDPFYYDFRFRAEVGIEIDLWLFSFGGSVGVRVHIWGPDFGGKATVSIGPVDFTIRFGASQDFTKDPMRLVDFVRGHLASPEAQDAPIIKVPGLTEVEVVDGNVAEGQEDDDKRPLQLRPEFTLAVRTKIPASQMQHHALGPVPIGRGRTMAPNWKVVHDSGAQQPMSFHEEVDFVPAQIDDVRSVLRVRFVPRQGQHAATPSHIEATVRRSKLPKAQFRMGSVLKEGLYLPDETGEPTVALMDRIELRGRTQMVPPLPMVVKPAEERSAVPHALPLTCGVPESGVVMREWRAWLGTDGRLDRQLSRVDFEAVLVKAPQWSGRAARLASYQVAPQAGTLGRTFARHEVAAKRAHITWEGKVERPQRHRETPVRSQPEVVGLISQGTTMVKPATRTLAKTSLPDAQMAERATRVPAPRTVRRGRWLAGVGYAQVSLSGPSKAAGAPAISVVARDDMPEADGKLLASWTSRMLRRGNKLGVGAAQFVDMGVTGGRLEDGAFTLMLSGKQATRVVFLSRGDRVLGDEEVGLGSSAIPVPPQTARFVVVGLGAPTKPMTRTQPDVIATHRTHRPISMEHARGKAAAGFDEDSLLLRVGARLYLGRGCLLRIVKGDSVSPRRIDAVRAPDLLPTAREIDTLLPGGIGTLAVLVRGAAGQTLAELDREARLRDGKLSLVAMRSEDGKLGRPITVVRGDDALIVRDFGSKADWTLNLIRGAHRRIAGVAVLPGTAKEHAVRFAAMERWDLVEDGPLSRGGGTAVRLVRTKR